MSNGYSEAFFATYCQVFTRFSDRDAERSNDGYVWSVGVKNDCQRLDAIMLPDQDFYDFQLFAPPDLGSYNMYESLMMTDSTLSTIVCIGESHSSNCRDSWTDTGPHQIVSVIRKLQYLHLPLSDLNNDYHWNFHKTIRLFVQTTTTASTGAGQASDQVNTTKSQMFHPIHYSF